MLAPQSDGRWQSTLLYSFKCCKDGYFPYYSGLTFDAAGNLYGTTLNGGGIGVCGGYDGCGTVYKLAPNGDGTWTYSSLYHFTGGIDGGEPEAGVILDQAGSLYGTTFGGGTSNFGTVFKLVPGTDGTWTQNVIYSFSGLDGANPVGKLIFDSAGNLYGTTYGGGAHNAGTAFKLTPTPDGTWQQILLCQFAGRNGANPRSDLILDSLGNLYGTAFGGGRFGAGVVFKLTPESDGSYKQSVLHSFRPHMEGLNPAAGVIFGPHGALYGTTWFNAIGMGYGSAFQLSPRPDGGWKQKILHHFTGGSDGAGATSKLLMDDAGALYGTATGYTNGDCFQMDGCGVVFQITP
jgi:uncharacterized repeat protein (TIGR03803 family)